MLWVVSGGGVSMPENYIPAFIFIAVAMAIPVVTLGIAKLVRPENPFKTKLMPYECGVDPGRGEVHVYRRDGTLSVVGGDAALDGEDVLPGFTCPVRQLFD